VLDGPRWTDDGSYESVVQDPDGNRVCTGPFGLGPVQQVEDTAGWTISGLLRERPGRSAAHTIAWLWSATPSLAKTQNHVRGA
jgi:hypothetical protein